MFEKKDMLVNKVIITGLHRYPARTRKKRRLDTEIGCFEKKNIFNANKWALQDVQKILHWKRLRFIRVMHCSRFWVVGHLRKNLKKCDYPIQKIYSKIGDL